MKFSTALLATIVIASSVMASPLQARQVSSSTQSATLSTTASALPNASPAPPKSPQLLGVTDAKPNLAVPSGLIGQLRNADSAAARTKQLADKVSSNETRLVFDLNPSANPGVKPGQGGQVDLAAAANFPALVGQNVAVAGFFFSACGLNPMHTHPRATELLTVVTDSQISTGFIMENAFNTALTANLTQYQTTVLPMGSQHWVQNQDCQPAVAIASFSSEDPGVSTTASILAQAPAEIIAASFGVPDLIDASNFNKFKDAIPASLALGVEQCLARCNIQAK